MKRDLDDLTSQIMYSETRRSVNKEKIVIFSFQVFAMTISIQLLEKTHENCKLVPEQQEEITVWIHPVCLI